MATPTWNSADFFGEPPVYNIPVSNFLKPISNPVTVPAPGREASTEEKLDFIIQQSLKTTEQVGEIRQLLGNHQSRILRVEKELDSTQNQLKKMQEQLNRQEQLSKNLNIRVSGVPVSPDANTAKAVYDKVLKPIISTAKNQEAITSVPQLANCITSAYRLRSRSGQAPSDSPPQILVKLSSSNIKSHIFNHKKETFPPPSKDDPGSGVFISEELTTLPYRCLKALKADSRVKGAWSTDGAVKFTLKDDPSTTRRAVNVLDSIDSIINA